MKKTAVLAMLFTLPFGTFVTASEAPILITVCADASLCDERKIIVMPEMQT